MPMQFLNIDGVDFYTIRGTVNLRQTLPATIRSPRAWEADVYLETLQQDNTILSAMTGTPVAVTLPDGVVIPQATIVAESLPEPHRPAIGRITIHELLT